MSITLIVLTAIAGLLVLPFLAIILYLLFAALLYASVILWAVIIYLLALPYYAADSLVGKWNKK